MVVSDQHTGRKHTPGTCYGCGEKVEGPRPGSWCKRTGECRPHYLSREAELRERGLTARQRLVPAEDVEALQAALTELWEVAREDAMRREAAKDRPVMWVIRVQPGVPEDVVYLDCEGHTDVPYVSRGASVIWEPLITAPTYARRGPPSESLLNTDSPESQIPPHSFMERLSDGFAMMRGYEGRIHQRDDFRGSRGRHPRL